MHYCPPNVTFLNPWVKHGLSHCFTDTVSACFVSAIILLFGSIQIRMYMKNSFDLDPRIFPRSLLYKLQIICHFILSLVPLIRLILQAKVFYDKVVYGYMILSACLYFITFPLVFYLLYLERCKVLPSIPTRGHGLVLLVFWTVLFVTENITFLNQQNEKWWFHLKSLSDRIEFGLFIIRYVCCFSIFFLGLKAPGIPKVEDLIYYHFHNQNSRRVLNWVH